MADPGVGSRMVIGDARFVVFQLRELTIIKRERVEKPQNPGFLGPSLFLNAISKSYGVPDGRISNSDSHGCAGLKGLAE
jgi:hypothetical protein